MFIFANAGNDIRVITGLERGGTPATFLIPNIVNPGGANYGLQPLKFQDTQQNQVQFL